MQSILGDTRKADIIFHSSGCIDISARVAKDLDLSRRDVIDIMDCGSEFYLYVKLRAPLGRHEAMVFPSNKKGRHFRVWSHRLCRAILRECGVSDSRVKLCAGKLVELDASGKTALPIITKYILGK